MGLWTNIRDAVELGTAGVFGGASDSAYNKAGALYNKVTGNPSAAEKRATANMMGDQIKAYKEQTELSRQQLDQVRNEKQSEKRRIEEKQIRSLRRNYRSQGLLGVGSSGAEDTSNKLGG